jgi:hypothetical protein
VGVPPPDQNASSPAEGGSNVDAVGLICFDNRRLNSRQLHTSWLYRIHRCPAWRGSFAWPDADESMESLDRPADHQLDIVLNVPVHEPVTGNIDIAILFDGARPHGYRSCPSAFSGRSGLDIWGQRLSLITSRGKRCHQQTSCQSSSSSSHGQSLSCGVRTLVIGM